MTFEELNKFILHYLKDDKTNSALMLTAPWGTGKSYYIKNELKPFLEKEKNAKYKCLTVSLYGLKDIYEVSKAIYVENQVKIPKRKFKNTIIGKFVVKHFKKITTGKIIAKTVIRNIASHFNIDISLSDNDKKKIFESVNLLGKLIIFEDLERSGIDIFEIMGYVNSLVEQDGVKILLVANENEIIKFQCGEKIIGIKEKQEIESEQKVRAIMGLGNKDSENNIQIEYTAFTKEYLKIKEKTISDTIHFEEDYKAAFKSIIKMFDNKTLNQFSNEKELKSILSLINNSKYPNLRSFKYACQKTNDIFNILGKKYLSSEKFVRAIFFGIILFVQNQKIGEIKKWGQEKFFSTDLGNEEAPLFKFCYDYMVNQSSEFSEVEQAYNEYLNYEANYEN